MATLAFIFVVCGGGVDIFVTATILVRCGRSSVGGAVGRSIIVVYGVVVVVNTDI